MSNERTLAELYAALPTVECRLLCQASCNDVPVLDGELERVGDLAGRVCPWLNGFGTCSIHDDRPLMCRLWGVVENMRCPHGCTPTRMLTVAEGAAIVTDAERLAGGWIPATAELDARDTGLGPCPQCTTTQPPIEQSRFVDDVAFCELRCPSCGFYVIRTSDDDTDKPTN